MTRLQPEFPNLARGLLSEGQSVAAAALEFMGKSYQITRELSPDTIDCSTLVSQAHWIGAAIQTPFIAESQRRATNCSEILLSELLPGDAVFAYSSLGDASDLLHNHVALFLGECGMGEPWVIESIPVSGVVLTPLSDVRCGGGARRFCPTPMATFSPGNWKSLVEVVPKLARVGARLTRGNCEVRRHAGIDLYVGESKSVLAPFGGEVLHVERLNNQSCELTVVSEDQSLFSIFRGIRPVVGVDVGRRVVTGQRLGCVVKSSGWSTCNVVPGWSTSDRLHWELWANRDLGAMSPAPLLEPPAQVARSVEPGGLQSCNALYALKLGLIESCIESEGDLQTFDRQT